MSKYCNSHDDDALARKYCQTRLRRRELFNARVALLLLRNFVND